MKNYKYLYSTTARTPNLNKYGYNVGERVLVYEKKYPPTECGKGYYKIVRVWNKAQGGYVWIDAWDITD